MIWEIEEVKVSGKVIDTVRIPKFQDVAQAVRALGMKTVLQYIYKQNRATIMNKVKTLNRKKEDIPKMVCQTWVKLTSQKEKEDLCKLLGITEKEMKVLVGEK